MEILDNNFESRAKLRTPFIVFLEILLFSSNFAVFIGLIGFGFWNNLMQSVLVNIVPIVYIWLWYRADSAYQASGSTQKFSDFWWKTFLLFNIVSALNWLIAGGIVYTTTGLIEFHEALGVFVFVVGILQICFAIITTIIGQKIADEHAPKINLK